MVHFERFLGEGHPKACVGIFGVFAHHNFKVLHGLLVLLNHLIRFGTFVDVAKVGGDFLDAARVRENRFFKLLKATVGQTQMVVDIGFVCHVWLCLQCLLHLSDALLVLLKGEVGDSLLVKDLWIVTIVLQGCV